jgi:hypothetical protein
VSQLTRLAFTLLVSTLAACGGKSHADPGDGGASGSSAGGTSAGGTSNGTSGSSTGGKGHAGSAGTGGADMCTTFDDDDAAGSVNVVISNQTSATIYLGQDMVTCGVAPLFQVADASGAALPDLGNCRTSCATLRKEGAGGCPAICAFPTSVALEPNEVLYTRWDGLFRVQGQLPAACMPFDTGEQMVSCDQAKRIQPDTFTFSARAGSGVDCSKTTGAGTCSGCTHSPNGGCSTPGSVITGPLRTAQTTVLLDERYGVYATASSSPGPNAGDAELPGDAIALLAVELIFRE